MNTWARWSAVHALRSWDPPSSALPAPSPARGHVVLPRLLIFVERGGRAAGWRDHLVPTAVAASSAPALLLARRCCALRPRRSWPRGALLCGGETCLATDQRGALEAGSVPGFGAVEEGLPHPSQESLAVARALARTISLSLIRSLNFFYSLIHSLTRFLSLACSLTDSYLFAYMYAHRN